MSVETDFSIAEQTRVAETAIKVGTVSEVNVKNARVRLKIGDLLTNWLPWLTHRAGDDVTWWCPSIGEQMAVFSPSGDLAQAFCVPAIYSDLLPPPLPPEELTAKKVITKFSDGAVFMYDKATHTLSIALPENGKVKILADVDVDGNITSTKDITDKKRSMQGDRDIYNGHKHADGTTTGQQQ